MQGRRLFLLGGLLMLAAIPFLPLGAGQEAGLEDPLPLKRILLSPARLPAELEKVLVSLPRSELEERLRKAALAHKAAGQPPRLLKARYSAVVEGQALVNGSGSWSVLNQAAVPAILPLSEMNLALSQVKTADGKDAVIGDLDGKNLGLLVEKTGTVFFDWNARGLSGMGGLQFDLKFPACPVASLELKVPADRLISVSTKAAMLSGPLETESPNWRLWRLNLTGRSQVDLVVRKKSDPGTAPLLLTYVQSRQTLAPARCQADFEFQVEVLHGSIDQLLFDCDPGLEIYDVSLPNLDLKGWEIEEVKGQKSEVRGQRSEVRGQKSGGRGQELGGRKLLRVRLREPFRGTLNGLLVRGLVPLAAEGPWTSPGLRLRQAVARGETLKLKLHREVRLENWHAGQFHLLKSACGNDGTQTMTLVDAASELPSLSLRAPMRPGGFLKTQGVVLQARQQTWWQIGPGHTSLTTEIVLEAVRGSTFQIALLLPKGGAVWRVEKVILEPREMLANWISTGRLLELDLARPLQPGGKTTLKVLMKSPLKRSLPGSGLTLIFPDVELTPPCPRTGTLALSVDPMFHYLVQSGPPAGEAESGPWGSQRPGIFFPYRNHSVAGRLRLFPQRPRINAWISSEVTLASRSAALQVRLELEPLAGNPGSIDLNLSRPVTGRWQWKADDNLIRRIERLPVFEALPYLLALGNCHPLEPYILSLLPPGQRWRLVFNRPLKRRETLFLEMALAHPSPPPLSPLWGEGGRVVGPQEKKETRAKDVLQHWDLPLVSLADADFQDGEISLQGVGTELVQVKQSGLREAAAGVPRSSSWQNLWRTFRYEAGDLGSRLGVTCRPFPAGRSFQELCDRGELTTTIEENRLLHHFRFLVWNWHRRTWPLVLPAGTKEVLAVWVDSRWVGHVPQKETGEGVEVLLPIPEGNGRHQLEILYAVPRSEALPSLTLRALTGWESLPAPVPKLPISIGSLQRRWRLAPGQVPLWRSSYLCMDDPDQNGLPLAKENAEGFWHAADPLAAGLGITFSEDGTIRQRHIMASAEAAMRRRPAKDWRLGQALEQLALDHLQDRATLVVDVAALQTAGLKPSSLLPMPKKAGLDRRPFWESAGLVYVSCPAAPLLTTRHKLESWQNAGRAPLAVSFAQAVSQAASFGQDVTGRFQTVDSWLRNQQEEDEHISYTREEIPGTWSGRTEWQPRADLFPDDQIIVVQQKKLLTMGLALGLGLVLAAWRWGGRFSGTWRFRLWLAWLGGFGLALFWAPGGFQTAIWAILLAGSGLGLVWYVRLLLGGLDQERGPEKPATEKKPKQASTLVPLATLLLAALVLSPVRSGGREPYTVFLLPGPGDAPEKQTALVSPDLLKKLEEFLVGPAGVVLTSARYKGTVGGPLGGSRASFQAELECYSFADKADLTVALAGVDLQEGAFLDGAPVFPVVAAAGGFSVPVAGKGFHRLSLSFQVTIPPSREDQELRFAIPKLVQSRLELNLPAGFQGIQVLQAQGEQRLQVKKPLQTLQVHLGRVGAIQVRWRRANVAGPGAQVKVREMYLWDLRLPAPSLTGLLQYSVTKGSIARVSIGLPESLEVRTVEVGSPGGIISGKGPRLQNWKVHENKGNRHLVVDFLDPARGEILVKLGLVPRLSLFSGKIQLALPLPLQIKPEGLQEGFLAYRLEGLESLDSPQGLARIALPSPDLFTSFWRAADPRAAVLPTKAFSFRRNVPRAILNLTLSLPRPQVSQEILWKVQPHHADLTVTCQVHARGGDLSLLEFHLPQAVTLSGVEGRQVHHWSRQGSLVQVWLNQPQKETTLKLLGWVKNGLPLAGGKHGRFDLPAAYLLHPSATTTVIQVRPTLGVVLEPWKLQNLVAEAPQPEGPTYRLQQPQSPAYGGSFRLSALPVRPEVDILTVARMHNHTVVFTAHLDIQVPHGELHEVTVELKRWPGDIKIDVPRLVKQVPHRRQQDRHTWVLTLLGGRVRNLPLSLSGRLVADGHKIAMPDVVVPGAGRLEHWLALASPSLGVESSSGLARKDIPSRLAHWPEEVERLARQGASWQVTRPDWNLEMLPRPAALVPPVQLLLAEGEAALANNRRWLHQASFLVFARGGTDLHLTLPPGGRLLAAALDDVPLTPRQPSPEQLVLPLAGQTGPHLLKIRWLRESDGSLDRPKMDMPVIQGLGEYPIWAMALVPPGLKAESPLTAADWLLHRAEAQLQLSGLLAERSRDTATPPVEPDLLAAQQRFLWYCRQAEYLASRSGKSARLKVTLKDLRLKNSRLAAKLDFDKIRVLAERQPLASDPDRTMPLFALPENGTPIYWQQKGKTPFLLNLTTDESLQTQNALYASEFLLLLLVGLGILTYLPGSFAWFRTLWPEQIFLLAWLGASLWGWSLIGAFLIFLAVAARLLLLAGWVQHWFHRRIPAGPGGSSLKPAS